MDVLERIKAGQAVRPRPLARQCGVSNSAFYDRIQQGEIRAIRIGKSLSIPAEEAARLLGMNIGDERAKDAA